MLACCTVFSSCTREHIVTRVCTRGRVVVAHPWSVVYPGFSGFLIHVRQTLQHPFIQSRLYKIVLLSAVLLIGGNYGNSNAVFLLLSKFHFIYCVNNWIRIKKVKIFKEQEYIRKNGRRWAIPRF